MVYFRLANEGPALLLQCFFFSNYFSEPVLLCKTLGLYFNIKIATDAELSQFYLFNCPTRKKSVTFSTSGIKSRIRFFSKSTIQGTHYVKLVLANLKPKFIKLLTFLQNQLNLHFFKIKYNSPSIVSV